MPQYPKNSLRFAKVGLDGVYLDSVKYYVKQGYYALMGGAVMEIADVKTVIQKDMQGNPDRIVVSNRQDSSYQYKKLDIRHMDDEGLYQITSYTDTQAFQKNVEPDKVADYIVDVFPDRLKQINIYFENREKSYKQSKGGKLLTHETKRICSGKPAYGQHNRTKNYILKEGTVIPPLIDMGVFTKDGKVVSSMYDKFKQINRFIEMVDDVVRYNTNDEFNIIDFGCGKSYLTFILYYYLTYIKHLKTNIIGLDLKADVIRKCNAAAEKYGYDRLQFQVGDIQDFDTGMRVDMVVTLHACDTATDFALSNAVRWNAGYILSVPCCQHEVNGQMDCTALAPMMKHGLIKERMSALATDAIRGSMLEFCGYKVQLMEFVDMAHSPKNILIRAVKSNIPKAKKAKAKSDAELMCQTLNINPTIYRLLKDYGRSEKQNSVDKEERDYG
ncbi:MAG: SAM-dependent methyltransferase [Clostridium sp.]|nr:SAM-dependent methyltransferase [Clostridium sp.]MCM1399140.1 SAM-dependent methyltransferase [Clostridium sp.]MCM1459532.1 SAM-dependent methyltransferase [Bacteroides sp.]